MAAYVFPQTSWIWIPENGHVEAGLCDIEIRQNACDGLLIDDVNCEIREMKL